MGAFLKNKANTTRIYIFISIITIGVFLFQAMKAWYYKNTYASVDLRNRIVGSRITLHKKGTSPYFYKWQNGDDEKFLDPYDSPDITVNRTTVTPFLLQLIQPVSEPSFQRVAVGWFIIEQLSLLLIMVLFLSKIKSWEHRLVLLMALLIVIGCSQGWLLHNINGQMYVFYGLLIMILVYFFDSDKKLAPIICGITLGILMLMRPVALIFLLPFLIKRKWKAIGYMVFLLAIYFIQQYYSHDLWLWRDYLNAMNEWATQFFKLQTVSDYIDIYHIHQLEGSAIIKPSPYQHLAEDSSLRGFAFRFFQFKLSQGLLLGIFLLSSFVFAFFIQKHIKKVDSTKLFIAVFLLYFLAELCLPAVRNSYNIVQWVVPLGIIFSLQQYKKRQLLALVIAGVLSTGFLKFLPFDLTLAELIFTAICFHYIKSISPIA